jgi:hypothetical protein
MQSEAYRRANTSSSWPGQALVIRMIGAVDEWNHPAFFDYVDRWMEEPDEASRDTITRFFPDQGPTDRKTWMHQGHAWEKFVTHMWRTYRKRIHPPPTGWRSR